MARVLVVWELGAGLGHVAPLAPVARALVAAGHAVDVALPFLDGGAARFFEGSGATLLPGPMWRPRPASGPHDSQADILRDVGFDRIGALATRLRAWRALFDLSRPDALVLHAAPTAAIASAGLGLPRIGYGNGWDLPPATRPVTPLRYWAPVADKVRRDEDALLVAIDAAMASAGLPSRGDLGLAELQATDPTLVATFPELDPYPSRVGGTHVGAGFSLDDGDPPAWPAGDGPRVFCYLPPSSPFLPALSRALPRVDARFVCYVPGLSDAGRRQLSGRNATCAARPVRMRALREDCDLAVCHAGAGTVAAFLTAGVPLVLLPDNLERLLTTRRVREMNAGLAPRLPPDRVDLSDLLARALSDDDIRDNARAFARRHGDHDPAAGPAAVVDAVGRVLGEG